MRRPALAVLCLLLGACGPDSRATPQAVRARSDSVPPGTTDLPASMPQTLEVELRRRTEQGDDTVLKLTPLGARIGLSRGKSRMSLRYRPPTDALESLYQTLREQAFDRITTGPGKARALGSSLRVTADSHRYSASAMGRNAPTPAEAYEACVAAVQALMPAERGSTIVRIRWDESIGDHAAALDLEVEEDLLGLHRRPGARPDVELHLAGPRPLTVILRHGSPSRSETQLLQAGRDHGLEVAYDAARARVVLRPLAPEAEAPATD